MRLFQFYWFASLALIACGPQDGNTPESLVSAAKAMTTAAVATTAPTISITSPAAGSAVTSVTLVHAAASDDVGVTQVEFYLDGYLRDSTPYAPYTFYWVTWYDPPGPHVLVAKAYDAAGNVGTSAPITFNVVIDSTPPVSSITSPAQGTTVAGMVSLQATASDDYDTPTVDFQVDGVRIATLSAPPYTLNWDSHLVANGTHTLTTRAYDSSGNSSTSAPVTLTVAQPGAAQYDSGLHVPVCSTIGNLCDSAELLQGRGALGPEPHAPNTLDGCADGTNTDSTNHTEQIHWLRVSRADGRPFVAGRRVQVEIAAEVPDHTYGDYGDRIDLYSASDATAPVWTYLTTISVNPSFDPEQRGLHVFSAEFVLPSGGLQAVRADFWGNSVQASACGFGETADRDDLVFSVGQEVDVTPPTVSITSPADNGYAGVTTPVKAAADDDFNVTKVEFFDSQTLIGTDFTKPFSVDWYTGNMGEGTHILTAKAYDAVGHVTTSTAVSVLIDHTGPLTSTTSPADNSFIRGTVQLTASASDVHGIAVVAYYDGWPEDNRLIGTATVAPYTVNWDTLKTTNGHRGINAVAYDSAGNAGQASPVAVTVDNVPPTVSITSPVNGVSVFLSTTIQATASDNNGVTQVAFYDGSKLIGTDTSAPYSIGWTTLLVSKGQHTLTAQATDVAGNVVSSAGVVVTVK